jgi:hypothetical protein
MPIYLTKLVASVAALSALAFGGAAIASAATSSHGSTTSTGSSRVAPPRFPAHGTSSQFPAPGTAKHEDAEKTVTGAAAAKAQAAAVKSVGGGTAGTVTTDYFGRGYEVTVTKSDGTKVEVHLDSSFNVMQGPGGRGVPPATPGV